MFDFLGLRLLLSDRLSDQVPGIQIKPSYGPPDIDEDHDQQPTVYIFLGDCQPVGTSHDGRVTQINQSWMVLVVAKNEGAGVGALITQTIKALAGWKPSTMHNPFHWVPTEYKHDDSPNGVFYFPMSFSIKFVFNVEG